MLLLLRNVDICAWQGLRDQAPADITVEFLRRVAVRWAGLALQAAT